MQHELLTVDDILATSEVKARLLGFVQSSSDRFGKDVSRSNLGMLRMLNLDRGSIRDFMKDRVIGPAFVLKGITDDELVCKFIQWAGHAEHPEREYDRFVEAVRLASFSGFHSRVWSIGTARIDAWDRGESISLWESPLDGTWAISIVGSAHRPCLEDGTIGVCTEREVFMSTVLSGTPDAARAEAQRLSALVRTVFSACARMADDSRAFIDHEGEFRGTYQGLRVAIGLYLESSIPNGTMQVRLRNAIDLMILANETRFP